MILSTIDKNKPKGWFLGPWNSEISIPIGYANEGIREKHYHTQMYEIYLIARGTGTAVVEDKEVHLEVGNILIVEPNDSRFAQILTRF